MSFSNDPALLANQLPISFELPRLVTGQKPEEYDALLIEILELYIKRIANVVNTKEGALYNVLEQASFQLYFDPTNPQRFRNGYRKVFNIGAIATGATSTTAHGITGLLQLTHAYGACTTDVVDYRPIPYASATAVNEQISLTVTGTNIVIVNGAASPNITTCTVVLEYLKT